METKALLMDLDSNQIKSFISFLLAQISFSLISCVLLLKYEPVLQTKPNLTNFTNHNRWNVAKTINMITIHKFITENVVNNKKKYFLQETI